MKGKELINIGGRTVEFEVKNSLSERLNEVAISAIKKILPREPFTFIPDLRIRLIDYSDQKCTHGSQGLLKGFVNYKQVIDDKTAELNIIVEAVITSTNFIAQISRGSINEEAFIRSVEETATHEGIHIWHIYERSFFDIREKVNHRLKQLLKKYVFVKNEDELAYQLKVKKLRERLKGGARLHSKSDKGAFVDKLLKNMRIELKLFVDYLYTEGLAKYGGKVSSHPFEIDFLNNQYKWIAKRVEISLVAKFTKLMEDVVNYSKIIVEAESITEQNTKYLEASEILQRIHQNQKDLNVLLDSFYYELGTHMAYVTFFANKHFTVAKAIKLSSFRFIKMYEEACSHFKLIPLVSLTSGKGIFDYKRALQELVKAAIYIKRI